ncbi:hypothetical protein EMIT0P74_100299 [Pseudomonas sp. IT-P74]
MHFATDYQFNAEYDTPISLDQNSTNQGFAIMDGIYDQGARIDQGFLGISEKDFPRRGASCHPTSCAQHVSPAAQQSLPP